MSTLPAKIRMLKVSKITNSKLRNREVGLQPAETMKDCAKIIITLILKIMECLVVSKTLSRTEYKSKLWIEMILMSIKTKWMETNNFNP